MKTTPHIIAAAAVVAICLVPTLPPIVAGIPSYPVPDTDLELPVDPAVEVVDRTAVLDPLVPDYGGARSRNPFNLRPEIRRVGFDVPPPPPPALALPQPPPLPVAEAP